jgi:hypothetical protein
MSDNWEKLNEEVAAVLRAAAQLTFHPHDDASPTAEEIDAMASGIGNFLHWLPEWITSKYSFKDIALIVTDQIEGDE